MVFQTSPLEHSPVGKGSAIDLHGWAEPGTLLRANGESVSVAADGLFLAQLPPSAEGKIVLEAEGKSGKKRFVRQFREAVVSSVPAVNH